jgi:hypothetical protein
MIGIDCWLLAAGCWLLVELVGLTRLFLVVSSLPFVLGPRWITYSTYRIAPPYSSERVAIPTYPVTFADINLALSRFS